MGEYYPGEITIGGKVPAALLDEFLSEAASTGASVGDYEEAVFAAGTVEELLKALDEDGHLRLADAQASYGQFEELEAFCVEHGIPFDRHSRREIRVRCRERLLPPRHEEPGERAVQQRRGRPVQRRRRASRRQGVD